MATTGVPHGAEKSIPKCNPCPAAYWYLPVLNAPCVLPYCWPSSHDSGPGGMGKGSPNGFALACAATGTTLCREFNRPMIVTITSNFLRITVSLLLHYRICFQRRDNY